jgi:hypothetical protein
VDPQLQFVVLIASRLRSADIPYMVTGSVALSIYAQPRMTRDIDLVVEYSANDAARLVSLFQNDCYVNEAEIREAAEHESMFNVIHNEWIVKADFAVINGQTVSVVAPEDLILSKLIWSKESGSETQRRDVRAIISAGTTLDWTYMQRWATELGVSHLLAEAQE